MSDYYDPIQLFAEAGASMFTEANIDKAMNYLLAILQLYAPVTRLTYYINNNNDASVISLFMASIYPSLEGTNYKPEEVFDATFYNKLIKAHENNPVVINDFDMEKKLTHDWQYYEKHHSYFCLPLATDIDSSFTLSMTIWADEKNVFTSENISKFTRLVGPFSQILRRYFLSNYEMKESLFFSKNKLNFDLLKMCSGLREVVQRIEKVAKTNATVLITGETGTGKEVVADAIQELSNLVDNNFVKINCGAIPESLIDSLLFGHEKGAFTGAISTRIGYFEQARGGTIFLDEIGELPLSVQSRLLRVLDRREIQRIGGTQAIPLNIRIIAATNRNLLEEVKKGAFREDLYFRLNSYPIHIPAIRTRTVDIITLAQYLVTTKAEDLGLIAPKLTHANLNYLCQQVWHGNVRELEHFIENALIDAKSPNSPACFELIFENQNSYEFPEDSQLSDEIQKWPKLEELTDNYISKVLNKTNGKIYGDNGAAKLLGIHPNTLRLKIKSNLQTDEEATPIV